MAQTFKGAETEIWKTAVNQVKTTTSELIALYQKAKDDIELRISKINKSKAPFTANRLNFILKEVNKDLTALKNESRKTITAGYVKNFNTTYTGTAYSYERWVNEFTVIPEKHTSLGFFKVDRNYIVGTLDERVAGEGLLDRMNRTSAVLQSEVRQSIGTAIIVGDSPQATAKNLERGSDLLKAAVNKTLNHSATVARTELLKAYSIGQEIATAQAEVAGVQISPSWDATLDGRTRPTHSTADGKQFNITEQGQYVLRVGEVIFITPRIPTDGQTNTAKEVVNCRCRRLNNPFDFEPTARVAKLEDGTWQEVNGSLTRQQWANTLEGRAEISRTIKDRAARANELRILRTLKAQDRKPTTAERKRLAELRKIIGRKK